MAAKAKFKVGDPVEHPADKDGNFPAGKGVVTEVNTTVTPPEYRVRCEKTGQVLTVKFKEDELSAQ